MPTLAATMWQRPSPGLRPPSPRSRGARDLARDPSPACGRGCREAAGEGGTSMRLAAASRFHRAPGGGSRSAQHDRSTTATAHHAEPPMSATEPLPRAASQSDQQSETSRRQRFAETKAATGADRRSFLIDDVDVRALAGDDAALEALHFL